MPSLLNMLNAMPPAQQIGFPLAGFSVVAFMMSAVQAMGANVPSTISNKEWPVATKAYIKFQNMNPVCSFCGTNTPFYNSVHLFYLYLSLRYQLTLFPFLVFKLLALSSMFYNLMLTPHFVCDVKVFTGNFK